MTLLRGADRRRAGFRENCERGTAKGLDQPSWIVSRPMGYDRRRSSGWDSMRPMNWSRDGEKTMLWARAGHCVSLLGAGQPSGALFESGNPKMSPPFLASDHTWKARKSSYSSKTTTAQALR